MTRKTEVMDVDTQELEELLERAEGSLNQEDHEYVSRIVDSYLYLTELIGDRNTTIRRLRKLLFGSSSEKSKDVLGESNDNVDQQDSAESETASQNEAKDALKRKGHGRNGAAAYKSAEHVPVKHECHEAGDDCPDCQRGTLYETSRPRTLVRVKGGPPLQAKIYELQQLRCQLCGKVFSASPPTGVGDEKYDASARTMIGLMRYGSGLPFNRLQGLQGCLGIPLPASTQWDLVKEASLSMLPAYRELIQFAAQDDVVYHDDTSVRILSMLGTTEMMEVNGKQKERSGVSTSGVVTTREGREIALLFSGRKHAGENLRDVLRQRQNELPPPIQMCDAASRNLPEGLNTILSNCLVHARRNFVELHGSFPDECEVVIKALKVVYKYEAIAKKESMTADERLAYHQEHSQTEMDKLHTWLTSQFSEKKVEPNSSLGTAINYMLKRWDQFTLFLRKPGAPLDNNIAERALKKSILHRKNSLFFKTRNGANVGDIFMSLILTCELNEINPFDYLTALQKHGKAVTASPADWMPWNYETQLPIANPRSH